MKLALIGDGLAARSIAFYLKNHLSSNLELVQIASQSFAPACSLATTAVAARRGVELGVSPLGDTLYHGLSHLQDFVKTNEPKGVERTSHFQLWPSNHEKSQDYSRRFSPAKVMNSECLPLALRAELSGREEEAFIFYPKAYLDWLVSTRDWPFIDDYVVSFKKNSKGRVSLLTQKNKEIEVDAVINAGSIYSSFLKNLSELDIKLKKSKSVGGSYWQAESDLGERSFSITVDGINLVYRAKEKSVQIGSHSQNNTLLVCDNKKELFDFYKKVQATFDIKLPPFSSGNIYTGLRQKGVKRSSFCDRVEGSDFPLYALHSLYKNGFTLSLYQAEKLVEKILEENKL